MGFKKEPISNKRLFAADSPGSIAGEGAAVFLVNDKPANALASVRAVSILHSEDEQEVANACRQFLEKNLADTQTIDLLISGESGDNRTINYYSACEALLPAATPVARFKHLSGEYCTASSFGLWLACQLLQGMPVPGHLLKRSVDLPEPKTVLLYNNYKGLQHSLMLIQI